MCAGGIWKGDIEELENLDASEMCARRFNAKETRTPKNDEHFILPIADGTVEEIRFSDNPP